MPAFPSTSALRRVSAGLAIGVGAVGWGTLSYAEAPPAAPPARAACASAIPKQVHAYVMLIRLRWDLLARFKETGKWPDDVEANRALDAHSEYWRGKLAAGVAVLAGGMAGDNWDDVALIVFEAPNLAEAERTVAQDPAVKAHVFQGQARPFDVSFITDKFSKPCGSPDRVQPKIGN
jgi:uncharacterized protein YciI